MDNRKKYLLWLEQAELALSILKMMELYEYPIRRFYYRYGIHVNEGCFINPNAIRRAIDMVEYQIEVARDKHIERALKQGR